MSKHFSRRILALVVILAAGAASARAQAPTGKGEGKPPGHWTILLYATVTGDDAKDLLREVAAVKEHFADGQGVEFILLIDRGGKHAGTETGVGEHFQGTRLYRVTRGRAERLGGGAELPKITTTNDARMRMGDPATLRQFVRYAKAHYPAAHYALFLYGHGAGRCMCFDRGGGRDALFTAAISETLERKDSVDLLVLDVCNGSAIENAYQWRPGNGRFQADFLTAAPGGGGALPYGRIVRQLRKPSDEKPRDGDLGPATITARQFGSLVVAQAEAQAVELAQKDPKFNFEAWACCDLSEVAAVKRAVDKLAVSLAHTDGRESLEAVRGFGKEPVATNYMARGGEENDWLYYPFFDLYDLADRVKASDTFRPVVRERAGEVASAVDMLVVSSFGQGLYKGFRPGKSGVSIVFPDGGAKHKGKRHWAYCRWYSPLDVRESGNDSFGLYAWCKDGATPANDKVENWFELLDAWYDTTNDRTGGLNGYRW